MPVEAKQVAVVEGVETRSATGLPETKFLRVLKEAPLSEQSTAQPGDPASTQEERPFEKRPDPKSDKDWTRYLAPQFEGGYIDQSKIPENRMGCRRLDLSSLLREPENSRTR